MQKITHSLLNSLHEKAQANTRKRINHNFHKTADDQMQRMLNAVEPNSYIQPHAHSHPPKREIFIIIQGKLLIVEFNDKGEITDHTVLQTENGVRGVEIAPDVYHTIISLVPQTIVYELKDGPYNPDTDKNFASWAPSEGSEMGLPFNHAILKKLNIFYESIDSIDE